MSAFAQTVNKRYFNILSLNICLSLNVRLLVLGLFLFGLIGHAHATEQSSAPKNYLLWPLLPGESLLSLAEQLYPQSPVLQQRFIQKTITLNRSHTGQSANSINLSADSKFKTPQLIVVPREQALTVLTHRIKKAQELVTAQNQEAMTDKEQPFSDYRLSFQLGANPPPQPQAQSFNKTEEGVQTLQTKPANQAKPAIILPKIVFEEPPASAAQTDTAKVNTSSNVPALETQLPNQTPSWQAQMKAGVEPMIHFGTHLGSVLGNYWQKAKANLQANVSAFKQGNLNDWLRHPHLKWLCLEGLALLLLVLYALIELRLAHRKAHSD